MEKLDLNSLTKEQIAMAMECETPEELIALANIRDIIFFNIKPSYLTLERMNITVGHEKQNLLISDIYGNLKL